jgi:hypothetical protein
MSLIGPETVLLVFLLFCRIGGCLMLMPGTSSARVPVQVRLFIALAVTLALTPLLEPTLRAGLANKPSSVALLLIISEIVTGALIGLMGRVFFQALQFMASAAAMFIGFGTMPGTLRALEGEMARTIQGMRGVKAARVHIVLPDNGSFRRNRQPPSASVIVRTESANDFSSAPAIRHLVAAAVPGMTIDQVTVLSTDGTILASGGDSASATPTKTISLEKTVSHELHDNIAKTLTPYLGFNNLEISVAARLNTDKRQTNETNFNPESRVERSVRVVKETGNQQNVIPALRSASSRMSRPSRPAPPPAISRSAPMNAARS